MRNTTQTRGDRKGDYARRRKRKRPTRKTEAGVRHHMCALKTEGGAEPLVSVVIPTCNRAGLLKRALDSVLGQTYKRLEIVVVDDASTDNTREVVQGFKDDRIHYLRHDNNRGGSAARNTGIEAATGKYIAFLDDDDEWEPEKTSVQLRALKDCEAVLCMSTAGNSRRIERLLARGICSLDELRKEMPTVGGTSALMARADVLKALLFDEKLPRCQDWDILIRLARQHTIRYVGKRLVRYNDGDHSRITNAERKAELTGRESEGRLAFFEKHRLFFGTRWYRIHVSRALLYGLRYRPRPIVHLLHVVRKCGVAPVLGAITRRIYQKWFERQ